MQIYMVPTIRNTLLSLDLSRYQPEEVSDEWILLSKFQEMMGFAGCFIFFFPFILPPP